jgi:hypothetical protein
MLCYFCKQPLIKFIDRFDSKNYQNHYICYNCPEIEELTYNLDIWRHPYHIIKEKEEISISYLYFRELNLRLHVYNFNPPFIDIKDKNNKFLLRIKTKLNPFDYDQSVLKNKIKTWIVFS